MCVKIRIEGPTGSGKGKIGKDIQTLMESQGFKTEQQVMDFDVVVITVN